MTFGTHNTSGYSAAELAAMNQEYQRRAIPIRAAAEAGGYDPQEALDELTREIIGNCD